MAYSTLSVVPVPRHQGLVVITDILGRLTLYTPMFLQDEPTSNCLDNWCQVI